MEVCSYYITPEDVSAMNEGWFPVGVAAVRLASRMKSAMLSAGASLALELSLRKTPELPSSYEDWPVTSEPTMLEGYEGSYDA